TRGRPRWTPVPGAWLRALPSPCSIGRRQWAALRDWRPSGPSSYLRCDAVEQLGVGGAERGDSFALKIRSDRVEIDTGLRRPIKRLLGCGGVHAERMLHVAVIGERLESAHRHRIDCLRGYQLFHVEHI